MLTSSEIQPLLALKRTPLLRLTVTFVGYLVLEHIDAAANAIPTDKQ